MAGLFSGKIALITGASRGLGRATALALAKGGAHVILLAKQTAALRAADDAIRREGGSATLTPLDLTDGAGLDRLGAAIFERWGRLDILVGSASALGALSPVSHIQPALWDEILAVNLTANWRLIRSLEPLLRQSPAGRAVFLTCDEARQKKTLLERLCQQQSGAQNSHSHLGAGNGGSREQITDQSLRSCRGGDRDAPRHLSRRRPLPDPEARRGH